MLDSFIGNDYGTQHSSVRSTVEWNGKAWQAKCAACPELAVARDIQDDALWLAWSHHQAAHPQSVMKFQLL